MPYTAINWRELMTNKLHGLWKPQNANYFADCNEFGAVLNIMPSKYGFHTILWAIIPLLAHLQTNSSEWIAISILHNEFKWLECGYFFFLCHTKNEARGKTAWKCAAKHIEEKKCAENWQQRYLDSPAIYLVDFVGEHMLSA